MTDGLKICGNCAWRKPYVPGRKVFCRLEPPAVFTGYPVKQAGETCGNHMPEKTGRENPE